jgi:transcription initiation factor TFIID subunit 2
VWGSTEIDVVQKTEEVQIALHAQQMSIDSIALISSEGAEKDEAGKAGKGEEVVASYQYRAPKQVVPDGDPGTKEVRDIHNFTLKYKSSLAQSDAGELLIFIPTYGVSSHKVPNNHPAKDEPSDAGWTMWKVKIKFTLRKPKGGLVFAGGLAGDVGAHLFTDGQCGGPRTWFPCWDMLDAANTFEIIVNVPKGNTVLCSAPLLTQKPKKGKDRRGAIERFQFKTKNSGMIAARCIALAVGPFVQLQDAGMSQRVSHWCVPHSNAEQRLAFSTQFVSRSLEILRSLLSGHELPCETLHVVFVSNPPDDIESYPGLLMASSSLLYDASVISQSFETLAVLVRGLVGQWFGLNGAVRPESRQDTWLVHGIAAYLTHMCLRRFYGNNDYMFKIMEETEWVCCHDSSTVAPLCSEAAAHPIEHSSELRMRKAALVVRLIEKRIGEANMKKVLAQLMAKAHKTADCPVLGTKNLFKIIKKCSGQDIVQVMHHWILASGCSIMTANFNLNKKRGQIEFGMRINNHHLRSKSKQDTLTIRVHETEVTYDRAVKVEADEFIVGDAV